MTVRIQPGLALTFAATMFAASLGGGAMAQAPTHGHAQAEPHAQQSPPQGGRATDAPLRTHMTRIRDLVAARLAAAEAGETGDARLREAAAQVRAEVDGIITDCRLQPDADAALHAVLADLLTGAEAMAGEDARRPPARGLVQAAGAVNDYGRRFDHPGFQPIRAGL